MNFLDMDYVVFDVETTGLSPVDGDRIMEIAAARVRRGEVIARFGVEKPGYKIHEGTQLSFL